MTGADRRFELLAGDGATLRTLSGFALRCGDRQDTPLLCAALGLGEGHHPRFGPRRAARQGSGC